MGLIMAHDFLVFERLKLIWVKDIEQNSKCAVLATISIS